MIESAGDELRGVGAAADVEEVGRLAADLVDHVERAHGETGAVGDDADRAVEADVLQVLLVGRLLALVAHLGELVVAPLVTELALLSRVTLASSACTSPVGVRISGLISTRSASPSV